MDIDPHIIRAFQTNASTPLEETLETLAFLPTMKKKVKNAVDGYVDSTDRTRYPKINKATRSGKTHSSEKHDIKNLDEATKTHKLKKDTVLYRGTRIPHTHYKVGSTYKTKAHTSTSPNKKVAEEFSHNHHSAKGSDKNAPHVYNTVLKLHAKKGQEHLHVPSIVKNKEGKNSVDNENEHLLPRGTRYKVTHIEESSNIRRKPHVVHAEIVHPKKKTRMTKDG